MSRPKEDGLKWFPLVVGFFKDKRIRRLIMRFGADGPLFYIYILCSAYESGYCVNYDDDFVEDAAIDLGCSIEKIGLMLHYLLDKSLLDSTLFDTVKVLSSHGIQAQYQESKKGLRRDVEVDGDSWILKNSETEGFIKVRHNENKSGINSDNHGINRDKSGINEGNEIKGNKKKGEYIESIRAREGDDFDRFFAAYPNKYNPGEAYKAFLDVANERPSIDVLIKAIERQKQSQRWLEAGGKYIQSPARWLRSKGWLNQEPEVQEEYGGSANYKNERRGNGNRGGSNPGYTQTGPKRTYNIKYDNELD